MMRCAFVLLFGKFYSFYNPKWVILAATTVFEVGSVLCGAAPRSIVLIIGRGVAGVGAAGIFTGTMVAVKYLFPLQKRPIAIGLLGLTFTLSTVLGPLIGGVLTDNLSWRWCFYINLPLGGTGLLMLIFFLNLPSPTASDGPMTLKQQFFKLDPLGFITFVPSIICLLLALEWGGTEYAWSDPIIIALLTLFAFLFVCFVAAQLWLQEEGTVPPRIARQRSIACALWFSLAAGGVVTTVAYYLPLWFQAIKGISATKSGISVLPNAIATIVSSTGSAVLTSRVGYYVPFMILGPILMAIGSGLLTTFTPATTSGNRILYQVIYGLGSGGAGQQASLAAQTVLDDKDVAIGAALMIFSQMLGSAVFISVGQNVFSTHLLQDLMKVPGLDYNKVLETGATELRSYLSGEFLEPVLSAYNNSVTAIFFVTVGLACGALLGALGMEWKSVKKNKKNKKVAEGAEDDKEKEEKKDGQAGDEGVAAGDKKGRQTDVEASEHGVVDPERKDGLKETNDDQRPPSTAPERALNET